MQIGVKGMTCDHCVRAVTDAVSAVDGVETVQVDLAGELVTVDGAGVDPDAVRAAVSEAGYEPVSA
ncbi:MAG: heavy-metal-associated domain-containing protein [Acidimicrobiales bacterium]